MLGDGADGFDGLGVERVGRILGNKTAVGLHLENAHLFGEVRDLAQGIDARCAGLGGHQADGGRATGKVPLQGSRAYHFDAGCGELVLGEQIAVLGGQRRSKVADVFVEREEAGGEAQLVHGPQMLFGRAEGSDDPSESEGLNGSRRRGAESRCRLESMVQYGGGGKAREVSSVHPDHYRTTRSRHVRKICVRSLPAKIPWLAAKAWSARRQSPMLKCMRVPILLLAAFALVLPDIPVRAQGLCQAPIAQAYQLWSAGHPKEAIAILEPLLRNEAQAFTESERGVAWDLLGSSYQDVEMFDQARRAYGKAMEMFRSIPSARAQYAATIDNLATMEADSRANGFSQGARPEGEPHL